MKVPIVVSFLIVAANSWRPFHSTAGDNHPADDSIPTTSTRKTCLEYGTSKDRRRPSSPNDDPHRCLLYEPPSRALQYLTQILVGLPDAGRCDFSIPACAPPHQPYDAKARQFGNDWPPYGYTMIGKERLENFRAAIEEVNRKGIPGAIAELGVWRGGAMVMAAAIDQENVQRPQSNGKRRHHYLFDAFGSIRGYGKHEAFLSVNLERVKEAFRTFHVYDEKNVHFVKGLFNETLPAWSTRLREEEGMIAVLRVDGNFYESYQDVMYALYESVPVGGIVIWDDIFHPHYKDVLQFWRDFKNDHGLTEEMVMIDDVGGWFRKQVTVPIDQTKKRRTKGLI